MSDQDRHAAIVVVNFGSHEMLRDALHCPELPSTVGRISVVIVDNYSSEAERAAVSELCLERSWHLVLKDDNAGFGGGMNAGVEAARMLGADSAVLLNPDAVVSDEAIAQLIRATRGAPDTVWAPTISRSDGRLAFAGGTLNLTRGTLSSRGLPAVARDASAVEPVEPWLSGACLALSLTLWDALGGFDPDYFMYWEDVDLTVRAHRSGARLSLIAAGIVHDPGGTQRALAGPAKSPLYVRYNCRNRLVFAAKLLPPAARRRWSAYAPNFAVEVVLRSGRRALVRRPSLIAAAVLGTIEGLLYVMRHSGQGPEVRPRRQR